MLPFKCWLLPAVIFILVGTVPLHAQQINWENWKTDTANKVIALDELAPGGPPKDGIPSIDDPEFVSADQAESWIGPKEPVLAVEGDGEARAYPLQIMIWHEIVNDRFGGRPLLVTFCPLCYSALVFDRRVDGEVLEFGVSGFLRHSDLVMYDRKTETLWQQFTGEAIVGAYVGTRLEQYPSQIISFTQFRERYPGGAVLSRNTGYGRNYGNNPYTGYDDIGTSPLVDTDTKDMSPMEKVIGVRIGERTKTYPYSITEKRKVINDRIGDTPLVVFHLEGARSALDASRLSESREDGSTGAFRRRAGGKLLDFELRSGDIFDRQTGSRWDITGRATQGPLEGEQLQPVTAGDYFAFAWLVFWPDTEIYSNE